MLYGLDWLDADTEFPPQQEKNRIKAYEYYGSLFDLKQFAEFNELGSRIYSNFDEYFNIPVLLAYQRLSTIKLADMVIGAIPSITVNDDDKMTDNISDLRDRTDMDAKLYQMLIDYSRYGITVVRLYNDDTVDTDQGEFTVWNPAEWFPILRNDGTHRIKEHVLVWRTNKSTLTNPDWYLDVQRHPIEGGSYVHEVYRMNGSGTCVKEKISSVTHYTGDLPCLVQYVANIPTSNNIYGTSDYKIVNELICKSTERLRQILYILDRHSDPSMTGPVTMLSFNDKGEPEFKTSQFYAVSPGEEHPAYLTWDGQLDAAFRALDALLTQVYIMSEMGEALLGNTKGSGQAISGTAMRYKMVSPLEKARRVSNSFTLPIKKLVTALLQMDNGKKIRYQDINIVWADSLPKDPREVAELTRLQTGAPQITPLQYALMENYDMDTEDALRHIQLIEEDQERWNSLSDPLIADGKSRPGDAGNPAAPPNPRKRGSINEPNSTSGNKTSNVREDTK